MIRILPSLAVLLFLYSSVEANNITAYNTVVDNIFEAALADVVGYNRLEYLCNNFGARLSGTTTLENAIDWAVSEMKKDGFDSVTTETVTVTNVNSYYIYHKESINKFKNSGKEIKKACK